MKINLRRAAALQNSINDALKGISLETQVVLDEFQDAEAVILHRRAQLERNRGLRQELNTVLYDIRRAVGEANRVAGVDSQLTEIARMDQQLRDLVTLSQAQERLKPEVVAGRLEKMRHDTSERARIYGEPTVETSVLTAEDLAAYRQGVQTLRKQRQAAQDEVLNLNVRTEITLSDHSVAVLGQAGLI